MSVASFIPEVWAAELLSSLKKSLVFAAPGVVNRDYEGEISQAGDTVHINSVGRPTIFDYVPGSTKIVPERLTTAQRTLLIDQSKAFAFSVDDVDARQATGDVIPEGMVEAAFALRDVADQFVELKIRTGVQSANVLADVTSGDQKVVYQALVDLGTVLDENNVPTEGRFAIVPPWVHGLLQLDERFVSFGTAQNRETLENGMIGAAAGFVVRKSNNVPNTSGDLYPIHAGHPSATSYADQIVDTEAYRPQDEFSDAVKGLHVYGTKVIRPDALASVELDRVGITPT